MQALARWCEMSAANKTTTPAWEGEWKEAVRTGALRGKARRLGPPKTEPYFDIGFAPGTPEVDGA
jgi:hypothetical protein